VQFFQQLDGLAWPYFWNVMHGLCFQECSA